MTIRKALQRDLHAVSEIHVSSVRKLCGGSYTREQIAAWTALLIPDAYASALRDKVTLLICDDNDTVLGMGIADAMSGEIHALYIHPDISGQGLGSLLLGALEREAARNGVKELSLCSTLNAAPFYERQGYAVLGPSFHDLPGGQRLECIRMARSLAA